MADLTDRFGTMVFSEEVMKDYLPKDIWKRLAATLEGGEPLDLAVATAVAHAMKMAPTMDKDQIIVVTISGRGDKDCAAIARYRGEEIYE